MPGRERLVIQRKGLREDKRATIYFVVLSLNGDMYA